MGYSKESIANVRRIIDTRRMKALETANAHQRELHEKYPDVRKIDSELARTGELIMAEIGKGKEGLEKRLEDIRLDNEALIEQRRGLLDEYGYPADYSDVKYTCPVCSDTGFNGTEMCSCMKKLLAEEGIKRAGLSKLFETQSFDTFSLAYYAYDEAILNSMKRYLAICKTYAANFNGQTDENLLLCGDTGLGKTHISTAIAAKVIEKGYEVCYSSAQNIMDEFESDRFTRNYGEKDRSAIERFFDCDLLIIDDLGTENVTQFTVNCLYNIINTRVVSGKPMIINTNLTHDEMRKKYSDRIASRLFGEFTLLLFRGKDVRFLKL